MHKLVLVLTLLLAGCSGSGDQTPEPTLETTPEPTSNLDLDLLIGGDLADGRVCFTDDETFVVSAEASFEGQVQTALYTFASRKTQDGGVEVLNTDLNTRFGLLEGETASATLSIDIIFQDLGRTVNVLIGNVPLFSFTGFNEEGKQCFEIPDLTPEIDQTG